MFRRSEPEVPHGLSPTLLVRRTMGDGHLYFLAIIFRNLENEHIIKVPDANGT
jgi:hypothetical protein